MVIIFKYSCTFYYSYQLPPGNRLIISFFVANLDHHGTFNYYYYYNCCCISVAARMQWPPKALHFKEIQNGLHTPHYNTLCPIIINYCCMWRNQTKNMSCVHASFLHYNNSSRTTTYYTHTQPSTHNRSPLTTWESRKPSRTQLYTHSLIRHERDQIKIQELHNMQRANN